MARTKGSKDFRTRINPPGESLSYMTIEEARPGRTSRKILAETPQSVMDDIKEADDYFSENYANKFDWQRGEVRKNNPKAYFLCEAEMRVFRRVMNRVMGARRNRNLKVISFQIDMQQYSAIKTYALARFGGMSSLIRAALIEKLARDGAHDLAQLLLPRKILPCTPKPHVAALAAWKAYLERRKEYDEARARNQIRRETDPSGASAEKLPSCPDPPPSIY